jgi:MFS transporter, FHS family, L-fucose permease
LAADTRGDRAGRHLRLHVADVPHYLRLAVRGLGEDTKIGGSGLIMAILGGAVLTAIQGQVSDATGSINMSFFVPAACFAVIAFYALSASKKDLPERLQVTQ